MRDGEYIEGRGGCGYRLVETGRIADDPVNHPSHYNDYDVEVIEMMRRIWGDDAVITFCRLNAFKYRMRAGHKDSLEQDLAKERFYLDYINVI